MDEKHCKFCEFAKDLGYGEKLCKKRNERHPELYYCEWWKNTILEYLFVGNVVGAISHYCKTHNCGETEAQQAIKKLISSL